MEEEKEEDMERTQRAREGGESNGGSHQERGGGQPTLGEHGRRAFSLFLGLRVRVVRERRPG